MTTTRKWFTIACIMIAGLLVATPFRRERTKTEQVKASSPTPEFQPAGKSISLAIPTEQSSQSQPTAELRFGDRTANNSFADSSFESSRRTLPSRDQSSWQIDPKVPWDSNEEQQARNEQLDLALDSQSGSVPDMESRYQPIVHRSSVEEMDDLEAQRHAAVFQETERLRQAMRTPLVASDGEAQAQRSSRDVIPGSFDDWGQSQAYGSTEQVKLDRLNPDWQGVDSAPEMSRTGADPGHSNETRSQASRNVDTSKVQDRWYSLRDQDATTDSTRGNLAAGGNATEEAGAAPRISALPTRSSDGFLAGRRPLVTPLPDQESEPPGDGKSEPRQLANWQRASAQPMGNSATGNRSLFNAQGSSGISVPQGARTISSGRVPINQSAEPRSLASVERFPAVEQDDSGQRNFPTGNRQSIPSNLASNGNASTQPVFGSSGGWKAQSSIGTGQNAQRQSSSRDLRSMRTYRLRDGDTLPLLAERFLGDRTRYLEILEVNRDIIRHPGILPLNATIRIPPAN